jgi:hypothetical protein
VKNTLVAGFPGDKGSALAGERAQRRGAVARDGERQFDEFF